MRRPALLALLALVGPAAAQPAPERVDIDLLYGFLGIEDPSDLDVGGVDSAELRGLVPDGATVLATIGSPLPFGDGERQVLLGRVAAAPAEAADAYAERTPTGWSLPTPPETEMGTHGFVTNDLGGREGSSVQLCRDDGEPEGAYVRFSPRPGGGSFITVQLLEAAYASVCGFLGGRDPMSGLREKLPALRAPSGTFLRSTGGGGTGDSLWDRAQLRGEVSLEDVVTHFGAEIVSAGWTERAATVAPDLAASLWTRDGSDGPLTLALTARPDGPEVFALGLLLMSPDE